MFWDRSGAFYRRHEEDIRILAICYGGACLLIPKGANASVCPSFAWVLRCHDLGDAPEFPILK